MCLLFAVAHCGITARQNIIAVHVNHGLRGAAADADEAFVGRYCAANGIPFRAVRVDVRSASEQKGLTLEQAARELRYSVFADIVKSGDADYVLTAHHAADNAETVLMHLFRGAGLDGLRGIRGASGTVLRPFIDIYPQELDGYAKDNGIAYVTDDTNFIDDADRNYIRLNVMPLIAGRYGGAVRAINAFARECADACECLDERLDRALVTRVDGDTIIQDAALRSRLAARYVRLALSDFTLKDITREQVERVIELAKSRTGATTELSNGIKAARECGGVALYLPRIACTAEVPLVLGANTIDGLAIDVMYSDQSPQTVSGGAADWDKLQDCVLRFRRDGDVFEPFGGGSKKLKQYFIDNKIPKRLRDRIPLICRGNQVLVAVGMQISENVKQTPQTVRRVTVKRRW